MTWQLLPIKDFGRVVTGKTPPTARAELFGEDFPFITPTDIDGVQKNVITSRFLSNEGRDYQATLLLPPKTVCVVCIGATIGKICFTDRPSFTNQQINSIIVNESEHDPHFVFYALKLKSPDLIKLAGGAATPILNKSSFSEVKIPAPPLNIQQKIAVILSAYDDLIENNTRRIQILEEMARRIYEEWFVRFRFPGHEKVKMVESELGLIPEGWEVDTVANAVKRFPSGKKYDQKTVRTSGKVPVLDQGRSGIIGFHDDEPSMLASLDNPVIVFANHTCYQRLIFFPFSAIQNVIPFKSSDKHPRNIFWLHYATNGLVTFNDYKGHFPQFAAKQIVIPTDILAEKFGLLIKPFLSEVYCLSKKNETLRRTRDLLLPKLISGEIDVSNFPEPVSD